MNKFDEFIKKQNEKAKSKSEFNPEERITKFRKLVYQLYETIDNDWLKPYLDNNDITTGVCEKTIIEERLGSYSINEKWISIGGHRVILSPIGTIMIGTDARIDMEYRTKSYMLVHIGENVESFNDMVQITEDGKITKKASKPGTPVWKYVVKNTRTSYKKLDAELFKNLLMEIIG